MTRSHAHTLRVLIRIRDFLARTRVTPLVGDLEGQRKQLEGYIARLETAGTQALTKARAARNGTVEATRLARRLRRSFIASVVRAGRAMTAPEAEALRSLVMPKEVSFEQLVTHAQEFADLVDGYKERFESVGLAPDTSARLRAAAAELSAAVSTRSATVGQRVASTQGAKVEATAGRRFVRLLDVVVSSALESDAAVLAEWKSLVKLRGPVSTAEPAAAVEGQPEAVVEGGRVELKAA